MKADRNYSIDLLKCISMLMVIILHLNQYGLKNAEYDAFGMIGIAKMLGQSFCIVGVNVFVLITGYFLCGKSSGLKKENLLDRYKRLIPLWSQVETYSIGIYLVLCAFPQSGVKFGVRQLIKQALPLLTNQYWFFTVYVLLILVSPFINQMTCQLDRKEHRNTLIVLIAVFSIVTSFNIFGDSFGTEYGYSLIWFVVLYIIGGYLRRFDVKARRYGIWYFVFVLVLFVFHLLMNFGPKAIHGVLSILSGTFTSIFVLGASILLFLAFLKSKKQYKKTGKLIALVSSLSFAVYLIHEHSLFRDILWQQIVCLNNYTNRVEVYFAVVIISIVGIYMTSILTELVRTQLFGLIKSVIKKPKRSE